MHDRHHECHANADCFNTYGSYICVCKDEFRAHEAVAMQGVISTDCAAASTPPRLRKLPRRVGCGQIILKKVSTSLLRTGRQRPAVMLSSGENRSRPKVFRLG